MFSVFPLEIFPRWWLFWRKTQAPRRRAPQQTDRQTVNAAMQIRLAHGARRHEVTISGSATVAELKDKLQPLTGVPPELQVLTVLSRHQLEPQIQPRP